MLLRSLLSQKKKLSRIHIIIIMNINIISNALIVHNVATSINFLQEGLWPLHIHSGLIINTSIVILYFYYNHTAYKKKLNNTTIPIFMRQ